MVLIRLSLALVIIVALIAGCGCGNTLTPPAEAAVDRGWVFPVMFTYDDGFGTDTVNMAFFDDGTGAWTQTQVAIGNAVPGQFANTGRTGVHFSPDGTWACSWIDIFGVLNTSYNSNNYWVASGSWTNVTDSTDVFTKVDVQVRDYKTWQLLADMNLPGNMHLTYFDWATQTASLAYLTFSNEEPLEYSMDLDDYLLGTVHEAHIDNVPNTIHYHAWQYYGAQVLSGPTVASNVLQTDMVVDHEARMWMFGLTSANAFFLYHKKDFPFTDPAIPANDGWFYEIVPNGADVVDFDAAHNVADDTIHFAFITNTVGGDTIWYGRRTSNDFDAQQIRTLTPEEQAEFEYYTAIEITTDRYFNIGIAYTQYDSVILGDDVDALILPSAYYRFSDAVQSVNWTHYDDIDSTVEDVTSICTLDENPN